MGGHRPPWPGFSAPPSPRRSPARASRGPFSLPGGLRCPHRPRPALRWHGQTRAKSTITRKVGPHTPLALSWLWRGRTRTCAALAVLWRFTGRVVALVALPAFIPGPPLGCPKGLPCPSPVRPRQAPPPPGQCTTFPAPGRGSQQSFRWGRPLGAGRRGCFRGRFRNRRCAWRCARRRRFP